MARNFVQASSQRLSYAGSPVSAFPFTVSCWCKSPLTPGTTYNTLFSMAGTGGADGYLNFSVYDSGEVFCSIDQGDGSAQFKPNTFYDSRFMSANTWARVTLVMASSTNRTVYLNNLASTDTVSEDFPAGITAMAIGCAVPDRTDGSNHRFFDGDIADMAIWDVALTAAEVASLAAGYAANTVRPASLLRYWPLHGHTSPEIDPFGKLDLTVTGATKSANPRIYSQTNRSSYTKNPRFTGNITESLGVTDWRVTATRCDNGAYLGTNLSTGATYFVDVNFYGPAVITLTPQVDYAWSASKVVALDDLCVPVNPDTTPRLYKATDIGSAPHQTHSTTEPTWPSSGTVVDNDITWTYVADLVDPKALGPKFPS